MCKEEAIIPCDICGKPSVVQTTQIREVSRPGDKAKRWEVTGHFAARCLEHPDTTPLIIERDPETRHPA